MHINVHVDTRIDMHVDMCIDTRVDKCTDTCMDTRIDALSSSFRCGTQAYMTDVCLGPLSLLGDPLPSLSAQRGGGRGLLEKRC